MDLFIRLTYKSEQTETIFQLLEKIDSSNKQSLWLVPQPAQDGRHEIQIELNDDLQFNICNLSDFEEDEEIIFEKLQGLHEQYIEAKNSGLEITSDSDDYSNEKPGYSPDDIYVENKPFSIQQLINLIENKDLDLAPNFQRHFVWDRTRQSLLIESILLGLPLPSIYLSQYPDGLLTVVDGLQRIHTIQDFINDKLRLCNLEYLHECNDKKYSELKQVLPPLYLRRFGQTQLMCFVIDYRSPSKLKFDLFKRLNTGGKPLNSQEIRNCLSRPTVQKVLYDMSSSSEFTLATDNTISNLRMQAQEAALRFLYFREQYSHEDVVGSYNGKIDSTLDNFIDELNSKTDFIQDITAYKDALKSAYYLFGKQTFRKVTSQSNRRLAVNKLIMLCLSVLLSFVSYEDIKTKFDRESLIEPLRDLIDNNEEFYRAITYGTNSKWNIETAMRILRDQLLKLDI